MSSGLTWVEVDLCAIKHNIEQIKNIIGSDVLFMAVVKADAYGHGIREVASCAASCGVDFLGVARIDEAIKLRKAGIKEPILIFGYTLPEFYPSLIDFDLTQTVCDIKTAKRLSCAGQKKNSQIKVHVKVDTGMGRIGIVVCSSLCSELMAVMKHGQAEIEKIAGCPNLDLTGIYTHFATSDEADKNYAEKQLDLFLDFTEQLGRAHISFPVKHAANSAAIIDMDRSHLDMVRAGISIYGHFPSRSVTKKINLVPAMTFKTRVVGLKKVPAGFKVSYGHTYETIRATTIATVAAGYGDGYGRVFSSVGHMLVKGRKAPVLGRVCMDLTMLDVGDIRDVEIGDEVVIFGSQGKNHISIDSLAQMKNTINYEILTGFTNRVSRVYTGK